MGPLLFMSSGDASLNSGMHVQEMIEWLVRQWYLRLVSCSRILVALISSALAHEWQISIPATPIHNHRQPCTLLGFLEP